MKTKPCRNCNGAGKEPDQRFVGTEIKKLRQSAGLRQCHIALIIDVSNAFFCDLENGKRFCSLERFRQIKSAIEYLRKKK